MVIKQSPWVLLALELLLIKIRGNYLLRATNIKGMTVFI
jgi:hypothetical protein